MFHLNVLNDRLVFNHLSSVENSVVSLAMDGSEARVIDTCDYYSLCQVDNGLVYYLRDGVIRQYNEKTDHYQSLAALEPEDSWRIYGDRLFVFKKGSESVKVSELTGNDSRECYHSKDDFVVLNMYPANSNTIIIFEQNVKSKEFRVCSANVNEGNARVLWKGSGDIERVCPCGSGVILTRKNGEQDFTILSVADGGDETVVENVRNQGEVRYTCQLDGLVYYVTYNDNLDQNALHSYNLENHVKRLYR